MSISKEERLAELQHRRTVLEERLDQLMPRIGLFPELGLRIIEKLEDVEKHIKTLEAEEC